MDKVPFKNKYSIEKIAELGKKFGVFDFIECSSKTGENVELFFQKMALKM